MINIRSFINGNEVLSNQKFKRNLALYLMFLPVLFYFIIFKYIPMGGVVIAFKDYRLLDGIFGSEWVGLKHFRNIFMSPIARRAIINTVIIGFARVFVTFPFPIILAIILNEVRSTKVKKISQTILYLPHFLSWVVVGGIVITLFGQETGIVNMIVRAVTGEVYPFFYEKLSWVMIFLGAGVWKEAGFSAIIYLAAMSSIDPGLYESASIDGAGKIKQILHITIPGIMPTIILLLILAIGRVTFVGFEQVYVMQNSAVMGIADVISTYVYRMGLQNGQFSHSTAMGLFQSIVNTMMIISANTIARKFDKSLW